MAQWRRSNPTQVSVATATVLQRIGIQDLPPESPNGETNKVVEPRHRGEVADDQYRIGH